MDVTMFTLSRALRVSCVVVPSVLPDDFVHFLPVEVVAFPHVRENLNRHQKLDC